MRFVPFQSVFRASRLHVSVSLLYTTYSDLIKIEIDIKFVFLVIANKGSSGGELCGRVNTCPLSRNAQ